MTPAADAAVMTVQVRDAQHSEWSAAMLAGHDGERVGAGFAMTVAADAASAGGSSTGISGVAAHRLETTGSPVIRWCTRRTKENGPARWTGDRMLRLFWGRKRRSGLRCSKSPCCLIFPAVPQRLGLKKSSDFCRCREQFPVGLRHRGLTSMSPGGRTTRLVEGGWSGPVPGPANGGERACPRVNAP